MWFIFQHSLPCSPQTSSISVEALGFPWYRSSHPDPRKKSSPAGMVSSSVQYCFPAKFFFHVGEQKIVRWCQIRRIWRVINQFKATVTHNSHCNHRLVCRRALSLWNKTPFVSSSRPFWNVSSTTFQSPEWLIQCWFIWKQTKQLVSGKVEINVCQVSLLWHNSYLCRGHTFA